MCELSFQNFVSLCFRCQVLWIFMFVHFSFLTLKPFGPEYCCPTFPQILKNLNGIFFSINLWFFLDTQMLILVFRIPSPVFFIFQIHVCFYISHRPHPVEFRGQVSLRFQGHPIPKFFFSSFAFFALTVFWSRHCVVWLIPGIGELMIMFDFYFESAHYINLGNTCKVTQPIAFSLGSPDFWVKSIFFLRDLSQVRRLWQLGQHWHVCRWPFTADHSP